MIFNNHSYCYLTEGYNILFSTLFFLFVIAWQLSLKGQYHEIFCFRFFSWIILPQAPDNNIRIISNFFENSRRYSQVKVHHRCQRRRCQIATGINDAGDKFATGVIDIGGKIIGTISGCRHLKVNLKAKIYIYVSSTTQKWPNKIIKFFLIEDFFHLPPVSLTPVANLELRISPRICEKIWNGLDGILRGWGETDLWKEAEAKNLVTLSLSVQACRLGM